MYFIMAVSGGNLVKMREKRCPACSGLQGLSVTIHTFLKEAPCVCMQLGLHVII